MRKSPILKSMFVLNLDHPRFRTVVTSHKIEIVRPGQRIDMTCAYLGEPRFRFIWLKRELIPKDSQPKVLEPNQNGTIKIGPRILTVLKPNNQSVGDYTCRAPHDENDYNTIRVRESIIIEKFDIQTDDEDQLVTPNAGNRLKLTCRVRDQLDPVNITWSHSNLTEVRDWSTLAPDGDPQGNTEAQWILDCEAKEANRPPVSLVRSHSVPPRVTRRTTTCRL